MIVEKLGARVIELECPRCEYATDVRLRDVELEGMYLCAGCRATVKLVDDEYSTRAALQAIRVAEHELQKVIASINRSGFLKIGVG